MGDEGKATILDKMGVKGRVPGSHGRLWSREGTQSDSILDESLLWRWEEDGVVTELVARELEQGPGDDPETGCQPSQSKKPGGSGKGASGDGGPR